VAFRYMAGGRHVPSLCPSSLVRSHNSLCLLFVDSSFFVLSPQPIRMADATYERAIARWRRAGHVAIRSINDYEIAVFPLKFVATGGDNSWRYVLSAFLRPVACPVLPRLLHTDAGSQMLIRIPTSPAAPSISPDSRNRV
jgi:hypothetical protein